MGREAGREPGLARSGYREAMHPAPRRPRGISKAVRLLHEAPSSPCATCGRVTKTTTDGFCADCWAHKDGRGQHPPVRPLPRLLRWLARR
jgi:hypothetical protein